MRRNAMRKNLCQSIFKSFGRYIAIVAIIALGASLFVGLLMSKADMVATGQKFSDEQNMFDLRLICNYGWEEKQLNAIRRQDGIVDAEGIVYQDYIGDMQGHKEDSVYRFYAIPETINRIALRGGRLPEKSNECVVYGFSADDSLLGTHVILSDDNDEDALEIIRHQEFTIVGYVATPLYMDINHGTTSVGNGSVENIIYIPMSGFDTDYYTEIHLTLPGDYAIYSDHYNDAMDAKADALEDLVEDLGKQRFDELKVEAEEEYADGLKEYEDGVQDYEEGVQELEDAYQELTDAELEINYNKNQLRKAAVEIGEQWDELEAAEKKIDANRNKIAEAEASLPGLKQKLVPEKKTVDGIQADINTLSDLEKKLTEAAEEDKPAVQAQMGAILAKYPSGIEAAYKDAYTAYATTKGTIEAIEKECSNFYANEAAIKSGFEQLAEALDDVNDGWNEIAEAEEDLAEGWEDYEEGKQELADAEIELADARLELQDAREKLDSMDEPQSFILDRTSNVGYNSLDSCSDIVSGVSRVFPVFFLLVAALVCITTMTRMIDEERTQIGTLKALGYSNAAIINKYMMYAGSGAIIGCGLGVVVGSIVFPKILWVAYGIMLYIDPELVITFHWPLMIAVVASYTVVMLAVTWYCCRRTLQEEPAELIRPKAPDPGKKVFLEYLPFWHRIGFLNKVTIRNIFRYRQRLAMMLVGIGGCTALLVTGFGLRDSIVNVVDYQFQDVTTYDLEVYFQEGLTEEQQEAFLEEVNDLSQQAMIYHQSSMDILYNNQLREVYMIASSEELQGYIKLQRNGEPVSMPGENQVVLTVGVSEILGVQPGDTVTMRNADMDTLELTVSGIYDNHLYNYAIVSPETIASQWGEAPEQQMAFVKLKEGWNAHEASAKVSEMDHVMNVSVSEDMANMVTRLMEALDLVIVVVVFCAGLLAVIVLYNLTNININERIREIATIKVLGFNASETAAYVFKENIVLTVFGSIAGLFMGNLLLRFVMTQIKIDMIWFKAMVLPESYLWAIALTLLSACLVNFVFYFKLDKINMAEALKSVE